MWHIRGLSAARAPTIIQAMNLNSKYFDRIRIKPDDAAAAPREAPRCEWAGCDHAGGYRAPKGRHREGQYHSFCLDHVREYNKSYNYFAGMRDDDVVDYQRSASTGHRPTWNMGVNKVETGQAADAGPTPSSTRSASSAARRQAAAAETPKPQTRPLGNFDRRSFAALDLDGHRDRDRDQGAVQGTGETAASRRQWRRPQSRGPAPGDHPSLSLPEIGRFLLRLWRQPARSCIADGNLRPAREALAA